MINMAISLEIFLKKIGILNQKDYTRTELHLTKLFQIFIAVYILMSTKQYLFAIFRNPGQWRKFENLAMQLH